MAVFLDEKLFEASMKEHNFVDVKKGTFSVKMQRKENETDEQYKERLEDFELLLFLLQAKNRSEVLEGLTLSDGSVKHVSMKDIARLFKNLSDLLEGVEGVNKYLGTSMLFDKIDQYKEASFGEDDLLF